MRFARLAAAAFAALAAYSGNAAAQFAAFVIPARHELSARPGEVIREILEIGNDAPGPADYRLRTADWNLRADGGVDFVTDTLAPGSCRPWVKLERHTIKVGAKAKRRYRFEVHVPADAPAGLCRFALLIESADDALMVSPLDNIRIPVQGRIGVIVYVRIGDAKPQLVFERVELRQQSGEYLPVAYFTNKGNAQGRPEGFLSGSDASGKRYEFLVGALPVLPGETRAVPIAPQEDASGSVPRLSPPIRLKGAIEWEGGKKDVEVELK
jgi:hypothetical protein